MRDRSALESGMMGSSDDTGIPSGYEGRLLEHDRRMRLTEQLHGLKLQGAKGLGALNGAAAAASLAFIQALAGRQALGAFKPFAVASLALFLVGAFLAAVAFFSQYAHISDALGEGGRQPRWGRVSWGLLVASAAMAFIGGAVMVRGIWCAL